MENSVAGSGLEHTDLETMILTRYHLRHPAIVFDAAKIRFFSFFRQRCLKFFLYAFAAQSEGVFFLMFVSHFLDSVAHFSVRALEHCAQVVERYTVVVVQYVIGKIPRRCEVVAVAFCKKVLKLVAELRCYCLGHSHYLGILPQFT